MGQYLNSTGGATLGATTFTSAVDGLKSMVGTANADSTAAVSALVGKQDSLTAGTISASPAIFQEQQ